MTDITKDCGSTRATGAKCLSIGKTVFGRYVLTCDRCQRARKEYLREKGLVSSRINNARRLSKREGLPFDLTTEWLRARIQAGTCELTGLPLDASGPGPYSPAIDRVDLARGYTLDNVRVVVFAVNALRGSWGDKDALAVAQALVDAQQTNPENFVCP